MGRNFFERTEVVAFLPQNTSQYCSSSSLAPHLLKGTVRTTTPRSDSSFMWAPPRRDPVLKWTSCAAQYRVMTP
ncbi:hypothetical protein E2C01_089297 [Portunus trituberculatus]|uniref:Uncharacterized protein n=1 Tax=Portunus trituberculatus TaxID=210409 RepID=A0A5B7JP70_PORTR|nr:hypothetical protein [Portunus trituberculatus]